MPHLANLNTGNICLDPVSGKYRQAVVAEWLRRLTRNQIPSGSVGSNPTDCAGESFGDWTSVQPASGHGNASLLQFPHHQQARLAQSVEHETLNLRVVGSSPTLGDQPFSSPCLLSSLPLEILSLVDQGQRNDPPSACKTCWNSHTKQLLLR